MAKSQITAAIDKALDEMESQLQLDEHKMESQQQSGEQPGGADAPA
jgi:ribosome-associated translation inhibitor RaiA